MIIIIAGFHLMSPLNGRHINWPVALALRLKCDGLKPDSLTFDVSGTSKSLFQTQSLFLINEKDMGFFFSYL